MRKEYTISKHQNPKCYFFDYITWSLSVLLKQSFQIPRKYLVQRRISMHRPGLLTVFNQQGQLGERSTEKVIDLIFGEANWADNYT